MEETATDKKSFYVTKVEFDAKIKEILSKFDLHDRANRELTRYLTQRVRTKTGGENGLSLAEFTFDDADGNKKNIFTRTDCNAFKKALKAEISLLRKNFAASAGKRRKTGGASGGGLIRPIKISSKLLGFFEAAAKKGRFGNYLKASDLPNLFSGYTNKNVVNDLFSIYVKLNKLKDDSNNIHADDLMMQHLRSTFDALTRADKELNTMTGKYEMDERGQPINLHLTKRGWNPVEAIRRSQSGTDKQGRTISQFLSSDDGQKNVCQPFNPDGFKYNDIPRIVAVNTDRENREDANGKVHSFYSVKRDLTNGVRIESTPISTGTLEEFATNSSGARFDQYEYLDSPDLINAIHGEHDVTRDVLSRVNTDLNIKTRQVPVKGRKSHFVTKYEFSEMIKEILDGIDDLDRCNRELTTRLCKEPRTKNRSEVGIYLDGHSFTDSKGDTRNVVTRTVYNEFRKALRAKINSLRRYFADSAGKRRKGGSRAGGGGLVRPMRVSSNLVGFFMEAAKTGKFGKYLNINEFGNLLSGYTNKGVPSSLFSLYISCNKLKDENNDIHADALMNKYFKDTFSALTKADREAERSVGQLEKDENGRPIEMHFNKHGWAIIESLRRSSEGQSVSQFLKSEDCARYNIAPFNPNKFKYNDIPRIIAVNTPRFAKTDPFGKVHPHYVVSRDVPSGKAYSSPISTELLEKVIRDVNGKEFDQDTYLRSDHLLDLIRKEHDVAKSALSRFNADVSA
jgi:hypothetical protein